MPPTFDQSYQPRKWACEECHRVLGVVMRVQVLDRDPDSARFLSRLWVFREDKNAADVPDTLTLRSMPRGLYKVHAVDSCKGVECSQCGSLNAWSLNQKSFDVLMAHYLQKEPKVVV